MLQCINVKLKLKFAIELQAVYLRGYYLSTVFLLARSYLRMPSFGMIPVVTVFVVCAGAVVMIIYECTDGCRPNWVGSLSGSD